MPEQASEQSVHKAQLEVRLLVLLLAIMVVSTYAVYANHQAFDIVSVHFAKKGSKAWQTDPKGFRPVNLPFMEPGRFQVDFMSDQKRLNLDVYAQDCIMEAFLDGQPIIPRKKKCRFCYTFHPQPSKRCGMSPLTLDVTPGTTHRLAIRTQRGRKYDRPMLFFIEYQSSAFAWRLLGLFAFVCFVFGVSRRRRYGRGGWTSWLERAGDTLWEHRAFVFLIVCAVLARLLIAPVHQTGDIYQSALVYAEDFFHKSGWNYADLSSDYFSAKYGGKSHMHKPPGLYYQFVVLRWLFNFGFIFYLYLTAIPSLVGDLMLAYVIYVACHRYGNRVIAQVATVLFLMSAGIFLTSAVINRVDCVPIALLSLAVMNSGKKRFIVYLGLAVASKQVALFAVPWFLFDRRTVKATLLAGGVTLLACLPYLLDDPGLFLRRLAVPQVTKDASGATWVVTLHSLGVRNVNLVGKWLTGLMPFVILILPLLVRVDKWVGVALSYLIFIIMVKNVHEHYIMWSVIPLLVVYIRHRRLLSLGAALFGILTMIPKSDRGEFVGWMTLNYYGVVLVIAYAVAAIDLIIAHWHPSLPFRRDSEPDLEGVNEPQNVDMQQSAEGSS